MNSFTKGLLTGVFGVVVGLLISGSNYQGRYGEVGTFQISVTSPNKDDVFETILDTRTGEVLHRAKINYDSYWSLKPDVTLCCYPDMIDKFETK